MEILLGIVTTSIIISILDEYEFFTFNINYIINEIQIVLFYLSISLFFITYSIFLSIITDKKVKSFQLFKATLTACLKVFNLVYPFIMLFFTFLLDMIFTNLIYNLNKDIDIDELLRENTMMYSILIVISATFFYLLVKITFNYLHIYLNMKSKIKKTLSSMAIFIIVSIFCNMFLFSITTSILLENVFHKENLCKEVSNLRLVRIKEYNLEEYVKDMKKCNVINSFVKNRIN